MQADCHYVPPSWPADLFNSLSYKQAEDRNLGGVIRHSEINSVSGMEDILGDVSDFNQDQVIYLQGV